MFPLGGTCIPSTPLEHIRECLCVSEREREREMGRGKVQLKRIENKINRQVTFSKRRSGLIKKAHEISVLCEAQVALIVFSAKEKLYEYSSDSSMTKILDRYERYTSEERNPLVNNVDSQEIWCTEYEKLKSKFELLQKTKRHYMGEELEQLSLRELQHLEQQLDYSLKHIRTKKTQLMQDCTSKLRIQGKSLHDQNGSLQKTIQEKKEEAMCRLSARPSGDQEHSQAVTFFFNSHAQAVTIGSRHKISEEREESRTQQLQAKDNGVMLPWMLQLVTK